MDGLERKIKELFMRVISHPRGYRWIFTAAWTCFSQMTCNEGTFSIFVGHFLDFLEITVSIQSLLWFFSHFWVLWFLPLSWRIFLKRTYLGFNLLQDRWSADWPFILWAVFWRCGPFWCRRGSWLGQPYLSTTILAVCFCCHPKDRSSVPSGLSSGNFRSSVSAVQSVLGSSLQHCWRDSFPLSLSITVEGL